MALTKIIGIATLWLVVMSTITSPQSHAQDAVAPLPPPQVASPFNPPLVNYYYAWQAAKMQQLAYVEEQVRALDEQRKSKAGPIIMIAAGGATLYAGAMATAFSDMDRSPMRLFAGFGVVGTGLLIGGTAFLILRVHQNRPVVLQLRELKKQKKALTLELRYGPPTGTLQLGSIGLFGRF